MIFVDSYDLLVTSDVILSETLSYLAYEVDAETARRAGREILQSPHVKMLHATPEDHWLALDFLHDFGKLPRTKRPAYVDCCSLAIMRREGLRSTHTPPYLPSLSSTEPPRAP